MLYTGTYYLILLTKAAIFSEDMKKDIDKFDAPNYNKNNIHVIIKNPSLLGKIKDKNTGKAVFSFYGTGAKTYCVNAGNKVGKKVKGIKR